MPPILCDALETFAQRERPDSAGLKFVGIEECHEARDPIWQPPQQKCCSCQWKPPRARNRSRSACCWNGSPDVGENDSVENIGVTDEQAAALKTKDPIWAWHRNVLASYDWLEGTVTNEPGMNLQVVVVDVWIQDPPPGSRSNKTANNLEHRNPARRRTDKPHWRGQI
jgi:hypothetical protein